MKKIILLIGLISLAVISFGQRANKGTISINSVELDPIYTTDSPSLLWWNDTVPKIATKYNLSFYEPKIATGTAWEYIRGDKTLRQLNTGAVVESTNLYYTDTRARAAFSLTTNGTSGVATYDPLTGAWNIPNYASLNYTLPLATNVILGGIKIGYVPTDNNFALQLSSEKGYVVLPNASSATRGIASFSSTNFGTSSGYVTIANAGISYNHLANATISGLLAVNSGITNTDEIMLSYGGMLKKTDVSVLGDYMQTYLTFPATSQWLNHTNGIYYSALRVGIGTTPGYYYDLTLGGTWGLDVVGYSKFDLEMTTNGIMGTYFQGDTYYANDYFDTPGWVRNAYNRMPYQSSNPVAVTGEGSVFSKTDKKVYFKNDDAVVFDLTNVVEPFRSIASNTTLATTDKIVLVTTGGITITYPTVPAGKVYTIKNSASTAITVPSYTILSSSGSTSIAAYNCVSVFYSGSTWYQMD